MLFGKQPEHESWLVQECDRLQKERDFYRVSLADLINQVERLPSHDIYWKSKEILLDLIEKVKQCKDKFKQFESIVCG